jgi:hypothetical protein
MKKSDKDFITILDDIIILQLEPAGQLALGGGHVENAAVCIIIP